MKLADKFRKSRFAWTLSDFEQVTTKAFEPVHTAQGMQHRGYHGRMTQMLKKHRAKKHATPIVTMALKGFDASQPRWPKGSPKGGQWRQGGASGAVGSSLRFAGQQTVSLSNWLSGDNKMVFMKRDALNEFQFQKARRQVQEGARAVDAVLRVPKSALRSQGKQGLVIELWKHPFYGEYLFKGGLNRIRVDSAHNEAHVSFVHELGHLLDNRLFGHKENFGSDVASAFSVFQGALGDFSSSEMYPKSHAAMLRWWKAVQGTNSYRRLSGMIDVGHYLNKRGHKLGMPYMWGSYLRKSSELWARAFTQYIAYKSKSPALLRHISRSLNQLVPQYWQWSEFGVIAATMDVLFDNVNTLLLKEYNPGQPRWGKGNPRGGQWKSSVSGELLTGGRQRIARQVIQAAEKRHGRLPTHTVRVTRRLGRGTEGDYSSGHIRLSASTQLPALETAHEVGHLLDHRRFGTPFPSVNDKRMAGWRKAVDRSALTSRWRAWRTIGHIALGGNRYFVRPQVFRYALDRREQFARSYAQWLARKAGGRLRRELRIAQNRPVTYYWNDRDFGRIERELDKVFANG